MRAPFQVLAIPYRKGTTMQFCILHRSDHDKRQFVAGGGEDAEKPIDAAIRGKMVVSHLIREKIGRGAAHVSRSSPYLELSISRQPLLSSASHYNIIFMYDYTKPPD